MPFYNYKCQKCENEYSDLAKPKEEVKCPECGQSNSPQLPSGAEQITMDTKDSWRGVKVPKNQDRALKRRMYEYQRRYELEEMIEHNGLETAKRNGWLKKVKKI